MLFQPVLLFFDVSGGELLVIILVVFLVFGPEKMPEIARKFGRAMNQVKKASNDLTREFRQESSGIRNEILAAQNQAQEEVGSIKREINQTRARVVEEVSNEDTTSNSNKSDETSSGIQDATPPEDVGRVQTDLKG